MKVTSGIFVYYCAVFVSSQKFLNRHPFGAGKTQADFDCPEEFGYYPHETDCTQYYVCVFGSALQENCLGGLVYSRELQTCDWPRNADCITNSSSTGHLDDHKFSTIRVVDTRTHSTSPRSIPTQEARIRNGVIRPGQEELETGFSPSPIEIDNRLQRGGARKIESAAGIQEVNNAFEAKTNEDRKLRQGRRYQPQYYPTEEQSIRLVNETVYEDYNDYYDDTYDEQTFTYEEEQPKNENVPLSRRLPITTFQNRPSQKTRGVESNHWLRGHTDRLTDRHVSGPVPLPVRFTTHDKPIDRSWPTTTRTSYFENSKGNDWTPGISNSNSWRDKTFFSPNVRSHFSMPLQTTARKIPSFKHSPKSPNKPQKIQEVFDYTDYDYELEDTRSNRHRFENQQPVNVPAFSKRPESQDFSTITDSSRFAPPRSESNRFEPPRPDSSRFGPPRPDSGRFDPPRTESSRFDLVRPNSNRFEPSRPSNNEENRFVNRPEKNFEFQPRPDFPVTTPRSLLQPSSTFDSREVEYEYEYVYDELGNPVFEEEEESGEVSSPPVIRTTERTTTEKTTTTTTTTTTTPPRIERIKTTTEAQQFATTSKVSRAKLRGSMKFSETSAASSGTRSEAKQAKSSKGSKKSRPTLKPVGDLVPRRSEPIDISQFPPWRFSSQFETPEPDTPAKKCKPDVCRLPDCYCGGKGVPANLPLEETPQIILLTFDDAVNDMNIGHFKDFFEKDRENPNGCPIQATFYISHEWTDYSLVQSLYYDGHEIAAHTISHSFGEQFSTKKWAKETAGQRDILAAYAGVKPEDIRGMRAPFLSIGGNKMFKMLYDLNFTYDSSMPVYENKPPSYPYTLDYKLFHDCMIPPCPTKSYPGVWEVPMVMWQDLNGGRCSMGDGCSNPPDAEGVYKMLVKNFERHYTSNRAPFPLYYHAAWFTTPHHKEGFEAFLDTLVSMDDVWVITNWQLIQWMRDPTPLSQIHSFEPFQCSYPERPKPCNNPKVCNLWHKSGVRYMKTCQPCPDFYPWTGKTAVKNSVLERYLADES
ncbi:uncharacterized protein LOC136036058 isoform X2 [Artemia franciscana]|uniref:uncharacterized protein LOC136036058 isoform X2 n=1 Tax=Artemia franciscana TaxID=6661 RepID=UPI0032DAB806